MPVSREEIYNVAKRRRADAGFFGKSWRGIYIQKAFRIGSEQSAVRGRENIGLGFSLVNRRVFPVENAERVKYNVVYISICAERLAVNIVVAAFYVLDELNGRRAVGIPAPRYEAVRAAEIQRIAAGVVLHAPKAGYAADVYFPKPV